MLKKIFALLFCLVFMSVTAFADDNKNGNSSYRYVSTEFNYSIVCPKMPHVVPAALFLEDDSKVGEVLVFENIEYEVKRGWIVLFNAFNDNAVPNFNRDSQKTLDQYLAALQKQGYEGTTLIEISKGNKGVLAITAKEIEIDEDGDGTVDGVAIANHQDAITFFRLPDGRCVSVQLIGTDGINEGAMNNFRKALTTFGAAGTIEDNKDNKDNKDKKSKKK